MRTFLLVSLLLIFCITVSSSSRSEYYEDGGYYPEDYYGDSYFDPPQPVVYVPPPTPESPEYRTTPTAEDLELLKRVEGRDSDSVDVIPEAQMDEVSIEQEAPASIISRWLKHFKKIWARSELVKRSRILKENIMRILAHNSKTNRNFDLKLNQYSDLSDEEFAKTIANNKINGKEVEKTEFNIDSAEDEPVDEIRSANVDCVTGLFGGRHSHPAPAPIQKPSYEEEETPSETEVDDATDSDSLDWSKLGKVVPVRNQKNCGSCWAFSSSDAISAAWAIKTNTAPLLLSPQYLVDCCAHVAGDPIFQRNFGCHGGNPQIAYRWMKENPHVLEKNYPYRASGWFCSNKAPKTQVKTIGAGFSFADNPAKLMEELKKGPVVVFLNSSSQTFRHYSSGIITRDCSPSLDHLVVLVGYGSEKGIDYWIIKNSWDTTWGEKGFGRIQRGKNLCGIEASASRPLV